MIRMRIKIKLAGSLARFAGLKEFEMSFTGTVNLGRLIRDLAEKFGREFKEAILDPKTELPSSSVVILINGVSLIGGEAPPLESIIKDGDEVMIAPVLNGG